jgi:hypothetical protein
MNEFRDLRLWIANLSTASRETIYLEMLEKPSSLSSEQVEIVNRGGNLKGET